ncbi:MAG: hypothetical protein NC405_09245 [Odoribacter sp.]|nr:hypothetical protein [Odoribacter sp.]
MDKIKKSFEECHSPAWAQWISDVFSPFMMPTFSMVVAMWCTNMRSLPGDSRVLATVAVALMTGLLPFAAIILLIKTGRVHTRSIVDRRERVLPMSIAATCYLGAAWFVYSAGAPRWLCMFFISSVIATGIAMAVTTRWKISAHTTAAGGFAGMTAWCVANGLADVNAMIVLSIVVIIAGALATARLMLERHTFAQVVAGLALGFACSFGIMFI